MNQTGHVLNCEAIAYETRDGYNPSTYYVPLMLESPIIKLAVCNARKGGKSLVPWT